MGYALGNLSTTFETFNPFATPGRGNSYGTDRPSLSEIDGDGWRSVSSYEQPKRPGSDVPRESSFGFGDWVHPGPERNIGGRR